MIKIRKIINFIIVILTVGYLSGFASAQGNAVDDTGEYREVFGIARSATSVNMPQTTQEWKIIIDKIDNNQIDESVFNATFSEVWPKKYDKIEVRRIYFSEMERGGNTEGGLPSSEVLDAIWQQMLEEIEIQRSVNKKPKE